MSTNLILTDQKGNYSSIDISGIIIMWYGDKNKIPSGWAACDGTKGTPDLRGQFVRMYSDTFSSFDNEGKIEKDDIEVSYGKTYAGASTTNTKRIILKHRLRDYGGTDIRKSTIDELPEHTHNIDWGVTANWGNSGGRYFDGSSGRPLVADPRSTKFSTAGIKINPGGESGFQNNQPPYYVMTYIMKVN